MNRSEGHHVEEVSCSLLGHHHRAKEEVKDAEVDQEKTGEVTDEDVGPGTAGDVDGGDDDNGGEHIPQRSHTCQEACEHTIESGQTRGQGVTAGMGMPGTKG